MIKTPPARQSVPVSDENAPAGEYLLPLVLQYTYLRDAEQYGQESITYIYKEVTRQSIFPSG